MKADFVTIKAWLKKSRKDLKKKVISKSEFNRVRKIAGYNSFLNALESALNKSEKLVDKVWAYKFVGLCQDFIEESESKHKADVFFALGFKDGIWDFKVDFLPESMAWVSQTLGV